MSRQPLTGRDVAWFIVGAVAFVFLCVVVAAGARNLWLWMTGVC